MPWPTASSPEPVATAARIGAATWLACVVAVGNLVIGSTMVTLTFATRHAFSGVGSDEQAATVNFGVQLALLAVVTLGCVLRAPHFAWLRSWPVMLLVMAASIATLLRCLEWASRS